MRYTTHIGKYRLQERHQYMKNYCIVSHTHWDREWYLPFENFRMRLVDLFDNLLDILEKDDGYRFNMDAQTIVLEDYLAIRPEKRGILEKYVKEGRILVGPWYVQNDFHLTSGEATVRNLLIGSYIANEFGGCMQTGYAADQFGLISQLPQILTRFGLSDCVFGRGFDRGHTEFYWESEDGSKVLCEHMKFWYNNAQRLSENPEGALKLVRDRGAMCAAVCAGENYLLMNGVDHLEAQENLTGILNTIRPMMNDDERVFQDTLPDFMARLRKDIEEHDLKLNTHRGEFRDNGAGNVLTGTLSSRIYIKTANAHTQAVLEKQFEPLYTLLDCFGAKAYPSDYSKYMWKTLIQNHPHDSICGCSVDPVHRHMMDRFERIAENSSDLLERGIDILNAHLYKEDDCSDDYRVILLNGTQLKSDSQLSFSADIPVKEDKGAFEIFDEKGNPVPFIVTDIKRNTGRRILSPINLPGDLRINRYSITLDGASVEGMSIRTLRFRLKEGETEIFKPESAKHILENEFLRAEVNDDGTVNLTDKRNGIKRDNILAIEDSIDHGNDYNYYAGDESKTVYSRGAAAEFISDCNYGLYSEIIYSVSFDIEREEGSGKLEVKYKLRLDRNSDELKVNLTVNNNVTYHRVRILIPTDIKSEVNYAGQPFDCIIRDKVSRFYDDACHPDTDYVGVEDGRCGIAVLNEGIYEYEQLTDERNTLALTVLRSVGTITERYENLQAVTEGWFSPEAFCIGSYEMRLAVIPYSGSRADAKIAARSQRFLSPARAVFRAVNPNKFIGGRPFVQGPGMPDLFYRPLENPDAKIPADMRFIALESSIPDAMIISALKKSEDGKSYILRMFNSLSEKVGFSVTLPSAVRNAYSAGLNESAVSELEITDGSRIELSALPKEIVTIRFDI